MDLLFLIPEAASARAQQGAVKHRPPSRHGVASRA